MITALSSSSLAGRVRTLALASTIVLGLVLPGAPVAFADGPASSSDPTTMESGGGFDISVDSVDELTGLTATIAGDGEGVNLRAEPSLDATIAASVPDGATVELRVDMVDTVYDADGVTRWWPVRYDGLDGWISGEFLTNGAPVSEAPVVDDTAPAAEDVAPDPVDTATVPDEAGDTSGDSPSDTAIPADAGEPFEFTEQATTESTARVTGGGESVNVRAEPSATSAEVEIALDGEVVLLRIAAVDTVLDADGVTRWWPVTVNGTDGWISGFYLTSADGDVASDASSTTTTPPDDGATDGAFVAGDLAEVDTESDSGANIRASGTPDSAEVGFIPEGGVAEIVNGPVGFESSEFGWFEVSFDGTTGFVDGDLLILSTAVEDIPAPEPTETPAPEATEEPANEEPTEAAATEAPDETPEPEGDQSDDVEDGDEQEAAGSSQFIYPLDDYRRTQGFGCSDLPFYTFNPEFGCAIHDGLDLAAPSGTPLFAAADGTVTEAGWCDCGLGYYVRIDHGDGLETVYGHMADVPSVSAGQAVSQGEVIGPLGSTGISTGPHVHFMVFVDGTAQNPEDYLP